MTAMKIQPFDRLESEITNRSLSLQTQSKEHLQVFPHSSQQEIAPYVLCKPSMDEMLVKKARAICEKYMFAFAELTTIQRKFLTHYRCPQCGLLPLYHADLQHIKRVRCKQCGQLISFKRKGKYGKLRKEIALELDKEIVGSGVYVQLW